MSGLYQTYGCGCGSPTISTPTPNCDGCIVAPTIRWGCDVGPIPGGIMNFNIGDVTNIKLPNGYNYTYELFDFDTSGINSATVSAIGAVLVNFKKVWKKRKEYRLRFKIRQQGGIQSATGEIFFCMRNQCIGCPGDCDPITSDCVQMMPFDFGIDCNTTATANIPNWIADAVYFENVPVCVSSITFNPGTKVLTVISTGGGCVNGTVYPIKVIGVKGTVTKETTLNFKLNDKSVGIYCPQGQVANKCTGICEDVPLDLQVNSGIDLQTS